MSQVEVYPDDDSLARAATERFVTLAAEAVASRGRFAVALSGGATPRAPPTRCWRATSSPRG